MHVINDFFHLFIVPSKALIIADFHFQLLPKCSVYIPLVLDNLLSQHENRNHKATEVRIFRW